MVVINEKSVFNNAPSSEHFVDIEHSLPIFDDELKICIPHT